MNNITAICIVREKGSHLFEVLDSISDIISEIIIADTGMSSDLKQELMKIDKLKIVPIKKTFSFAERIREEAKKYAKSDYILFVDYDEIIQPKLQEFITENYNKYDYFAIPRKNIIFGKWIKYSRWWPDYQIRLIRKDYVYWDADIDIHVQPELKGNGLTVDPNEELAMLHYNYENIDEYIKKATHYAKQEARQMVRKKKDFTITDMTSKAVSEFISRFFASGGYRDGVHGFVLSSLQMFYFFLVYFYYWEEKKYFDIKSSELLINPRRFFFKGLFETNHWLMKNNQIDKMRKIRLKLQNKILAITQ